MLIFLIILHSSTSFNFFHFIFYFQGAESEVRAKFYNIVFQQVYEEIDGDENNAVLKWKVVDYQLAGDQPYY